MTQFDIDADAFNAPLPPMGVTVPEEQLLEGRPMASGTRIYEDGPVRTGIWEVTPGKFLSIKDDLSEVMYFIKGAGTIEDNTGKVTVIRPGATLVIHPGWRGTWTVTETTRKYFVAYARPRA